MQNLINKMWLGVPSQDKMEIRGCLPKLLLAHHKTLPYFIRNKLCKVIVDIGRQDWPMFYHDFFTNILQVRMYVGTLSYTQLVCRSDYFLVLQRSFKSSILELQLQGDCGGDDYVHFSLYSWDMLYLCAVEKHGWNLVALLTFCEIPFSKNVKACSLLSQLL